MPPKAEDPDVIDHKLFRVLQKLLSQGPWREQLSPNNFARQWVASLTLLSLTRPTATSTRIVFSFPVQRDYLNQLGILAGGSQAMAHDYGTSYLLVLIAKPGYWDKLGTSRELNLKFGKAAREGEVLRLEVSGDDSGTRRAVLRGILTRERDGAMISTSEHHMDMIGSSKL